MRGFGKYLCVWTVASTLYIGWALWSFAPLFSSEGYFAPIEASLGGWDIGGPGGLGIGGPIKPRIDLSEITEGMWKNTKQSTNVESSSKEASGLIVRYDERRSALVRRALAVTFLPPIVLLVLAFMIGWFARDLRRQRRPSSPV